MYSEVISMDARGNVTEQDIGGVTETRAFDDATGSISDIVATSALASILQDLSYSFDTLGNLSDRSDNSGSNNYSEFFTYDGLNRLQTTSSSDAADMNITYDSKGNITSKSNVEAGASYTYGAGAAGPHAVTSIGSKAYTYDSNGNMVTGGGRTVSYTTFNKPNHISKGVVHTTEFVYGPNRSRFRRTDDNGSLTTTLYLGNVERIEKPGGLVEIKRYIGSTNIVTTTSSNPTPIELLVLTDHIGSTYALIARDTQLVTQTMSFDAFGLRRMTNWNDFSDLQLTSFDHSNSTHGFTGHEQLDEVGLIHMNGRVYDPLIGRFLSADSYVDGVTNTQGYNRYSYVRNNPLSFTDPTGNLSWAKFRDKILKPVLSIIAAVYLPYAPFFTGIFQSASFAAAGFISGGIATGSLKGAVFGAFSAAVFGGINSHFNAIGGPAHVATSSLAGGVLSTLQGGKFGHGFISAGIGAGVGTRLPEGRGRVLSSAILGGTVSEITGGKFANGAATAAFSAAVSPGLQGETDSFGGDSSGGSDSGSEAGWVKTNGTLTIGDDEFSYKTYGPEGFAGKIAGNLSGIAGTTAGRELIGGLIESGTNLTFKFKANFFGHSRAQSTIFFDPSHSQPFRAGSKIIRFESSVYALAHEMHHEWNSATATLFGGSDARRIGRRVARIEGREVYAVRFTNLIRTQSRAGYIRTHYNGTKVVF